MEQSYLRIMLKVRYPLQTYSTINSEQSEAQYHSTTRASLINNPILPIGQHERSEDYSQAKQAR